MKKIYTAGLIALSATAFTASVSAQTFSPVTTNTGSTQYGEIDNRKNPMNTPLGTTEDQYNKRPNFAYSGGIFNPANRENTGSGFYAENRIGKEMWKNFHCAMLSRGLAWNAPVNNFANNETCGTNIIGGSLAGLSNPQLEYQRQLVREFIAKMNGSDATITGSGATNIIEKYNTDEVKNFIIKSNSFVTNVSSTMTPQQVEVDLVALDKIFGEYKNVPTNFKEFAYITYVEALRKHNLVNPVQIISSKQLVNLMLVANKFAEMTANSISVVDTYVDGNINIREPLQITTTPNESTKVSSHNSDTLLLVGKDGKLLNAADFNFAESKLPEGMVLSTENNALKITIDTQKKYENNSTITLTGKNSAGITVQKGYTIKTHPHNAVLKSVSEMPISEFLLSVIIGNIIKN